MLVKFAWNESALTKDLVYSEQQEQPEKGKTEGRTPKTEMNLVL